MFLWNIFCMICKGLSIHLGFFFFFNISNLFIKQEINLYLCIYLREFKYYQYNFSVKGGYFWDFLVCKLKFGLLDTRVQNFSFLYIYYILSLLLQSKSKSSRTRGKEEECTLEIRGPKRNTNCVWSIETLYTYKYNI